MKKNLKLWVVIPARSGSQSVKHKNIRKIKNLPLMAYTIIQAKKIKNIDNIVFTSDSKRYLSIAKKYGANLLHHRSKKNSSNTATDLDFFRELVTYLKKNNYVLPDAFIHLRPNSPNRDTSVLNKAVKFFISNFKKYSAMRSVSKMSETSYKTFEIENKILKGLCGKSSNIEKMNRPKELFNDTYMANGYIDIVKVENILKKNFLHGNKVVPFIINSLSVDIDSKNDLEYAKYLLTKKKF
jgi:CMP-N,N'-diacetyllegionaminic acid synthase